MREIKFRVFEEKTGKVERILAIDWFFKTAITLNAPHGVSFRDKDHFLMQYTGLKDKRNTEIYEGDIVKFDPSAPPLGDMPKSGDIGVIKYILNSFLVVARDSDYLTYSLNELGDWVVIGNIYENKELINEIT